MYPTHFIDDKIYLLMIKSNYNQISATAWPHLDFKLKVNCNIILSKDL